MSLLNFFLKYFSFISRCMEEVSSSRIIIFCVIWTIDLWGMLELKLFANKCYFICIMIFMIYDDIHDDDDDICLDDVR